MKNLFIILFVMITTIFAQDYTSETKQERDSRLEWWREARFGLFIHWGLYSIPAGEWNGEKNHAEWIRTTAQIPLEVYDKFVNQFNPEKFNAEEWVKLAKDAGMKYIVITSKHHDGFCLFDSKYTDFDVMSTPFHKDILKELADACRKEGIKMCFYHSIMDWHNPDYLPRRSWETNRSAEGANFDRFVQYLKNQLKELLTNYGDLGVLWFDGEWESTWNNKYGKEIYNYVRSLQPKIIINNRVFTGRDGLEGFSRDNSFQGDFGTPEQQIPATGLPGQDWESCITMNNNWGYNKYDNNFKPTKEIIRMIADIASKGGNLLLNIGPTSEGLFPQTSVERLKEIGQWMKVNGEAIYGTNASPFQHLDWGRCTQKQNNSDAKLYLHVFDWPKDGILAIPVILNQIKKVYLLSDADSKQLNTKRIEDKIIINVPEIAPDKNNSVVVIDIAGKPDVMNPPVIETDQEMFVDQTKVNIKSDHPDLEIRYTLNGTIPNSTSSVFTNPIEITKDAEILARIFENNKPISEVSKLKLTRVNPEPASELKDLSNGVEYKYFKGNWNKLPAFDSLTVDKKGIVPGFTLSPRDTSDFYGFEYTGYIKIPATGVFTFYTSSDDGSRLYIDNKLIVDNDLTHGVVEKQGSIALSTGYHLIRVTFFEKDGGEDLIVSYKGPGISKSIIPGTLLFHKVNE